MTDPIATLEQLPPESPPNEVVLTAVRIFRYRAIATVALLVVGVFALGWALTQLQGATIDSDLARLLADDEAQTIVLGAADVVDGFRVEAVELVWNEDRGFLQVLVSAPPDAAESEIGVSIAEVRVDGRSAGRNLDDRDRTFGTLGRDQASLWLPLDVNTTPGRLDVDVQLRPAGEGVLEVTITYDERTN